MTHTPSVDRRRRRPPPVKRIWLPRTTPVLRPIDEQRVREEEQRLRAEIVGGDMQRAALEHDPYA